MDDKKKLIVLGAMGVVLLGVGVIQFTKGSGTPAPAPAVTASTPSSDSRLASNADGKGDAVPAQQNDLVSGSYPEHDPFKPLVSDTALQPAPTPNPIPNHMGSHPMPVDPMPGVLPGGDVAGGSTTPLVPAPPRYGFSLTGVILGRKPAAVFVDAQGAQHLIELGGRLDGDTQLVDLAKDHVVLRIKDQTKTLTLGGGESSAK